MKLIKTFFLTIITLFLIYFLSMNNAKVDIDLLFKILMKYQFQW